MFTSYDKKQVDRMLEKAQLYLQTFRTQSSPLQALWQQTIRLQIQLDRIKTEEE